MHYGGASVSAKPPIHPLLSSAQWRIPERKPTLSFTPKPKRYETTDEALLKSNIGRLSPGAYRRRPDELNLVRAIYHGTDLRTALGNVHSISELKAIGRQYEGPVRTGDVLFFGQNTTPRLAVVQTVRTDGTIISKGIARGHLRTVFVQLERPRQRRSGGRILNSFIKVIKPGGKRQDRFLAGDLVIARRRYLNSARFGN
ncbi:MAG: hypothetical protein ACON3Z_01955 [Bradymonadia bacterium]